MIQELWVSQLSFAKSHQSLKQCNEVCRALKVKFHLKVVEAPFTEFLIRMLVLN